MINAQNNAGSYSIPNTYHHNSVVKDGIVSASQLSKVHSSGTEGVLPKSNVKNEIDISGDSIELHRNNHQQQITNIMNFFIDSDSNITREMVAKVLDAGNHGSVSQQELNMRPETALVILTLFEPTEIPRTLISSAAKLIKELSAKKDLSTDSNIKDILNTTQKNLDKQLNKFLGNNTPLENLVSRYQTKYVDPAIRQLLREHFTDNVINSRPIDSYLVSDLKAELAKNIQAEEQAFHDVAHKGYGDKYQHLNNLFRHVELKVALIRPLKAKIDSSESVKAEVPLLKAEGDVIDGMPNPREMRESATSTIIHSYKTTNNYCLSYPFSESIAKIRNQTPEVSHTSPEESQPTKQSEEPVLAPVKQQFLAKLPRATVSQPAKEPEVDYGLPKVDYETPEADNSIYQSKGFVVSTLRGTPPSAVKVSPKSQLAKQEAIKQFLPKNGHLLGSYLKNGEVPTKVTLSTEGALTRHQSDKEIYQGTREAPETVVDTASYLRNSDTPVTLTERGALTCDQSKKDAYTTDQ